MASLREYQRRSVIPLAGISLVAYYLIVVVPLDRRSENLNVPLQKTWRKLAGAIDSSNSVAIDFRHITNQLNETRMAVSILSDARQKAQSRLEVSSTVRARMNTQFELIDYENERGKQIDELKQLAAQKNVKVEPAVYAGFPEHTADTRQPSLLWPALSCAEYLVRGAVQCGASSINSLAMPAPFTNNFDLDFTEPLSAIPIDVEITGPYNAILKFVQYLPLRSEELRAAGLPQENPDKPPLYIDRILIRKQGPEKPDEVRLALRAVGFIFRDQP